MKFNFILFLVISVSTSVAQNPIHATRKTYEAAEEGDGGLGKETCKEA